MVEVTNASGSMTTATAVTAVVSVVAASLVWWSRVRRLTRLRISVARITGISEEIMSAATAEEAEALARKRLTDAVGASSVRIVMREREGDAGFSEEEPGGEQCTVGFPMKCDKRQLGTLEVTWAGGKCPLQLDERAALEHLANQIAIALELHDRRLLREQVVRGEKMGATGRLIALVAEEMAEPLERIEHAAAALASEEASEALRKPASEARRILERLLSLGESQQAAFKPLNVQALVSGLVEFRKRAWRMKDLDVSVAVGSAPLVAVGVWGAVENAVLSVLVHAEQEAMAAGGGLRIATNRAGGVARIEIEQPQETVRSETELPESSRVVLEELGGVLRREIRGESVAWVIELPLAQEVDQDNPVGSPPKPVQSMTLLVAEPEAARSRGLVERLAQRGHRVVPAAGGGEAAEMMAGVEFDAVFAPAALPDMSWVELHARARTAGCRMVLMCDSGETMDHVLARSGEVIAARRPLGDEELDQALLSIGLRE